MYRRRTIILTASIVILSAICWANPLCPDLSQNDRVDFADFAMLANNWHKTDSSLLGDFDGNGTVDMRDLQWFASYWLNDYECKNADFNSDYIVNFLDFAKLADIWLSDSGDTNWNDKYDLNQNGSIDNGDLEILSRRWLKTYPEPNGIFDAFKAALANGDVETALTFVAESSKGRYSEIFQAIGLNLPGYAAGMGTLTLESQDEDRAVYEMTHQKGATTYKFPVVFIKDDNGQWKIFNF